MTHSFTLWVDLPPPIILDDDDDDEEPEGDGGERGEKDLLSADEGRSCSAAACR